MRSPHSRSGRIPAVVVGGSLNGLGVVRSLAAGGVPVFLLESSRDCAAGWSRYCTLVPAPALEGAALVEQLLELASTLGCAPALILTSDPAVVTVSAHRDRLQAAYRFALPPAESVSASYDKIAFQRFAEAARLPVPRGIAIDCDADLDRLHELGPALIIKPADKARVLAGAVERAVRAGTVAEARRAAARMLRAASPLIIQDWVEGPDSEIFFALFTCDRDGGMAGFFAGRKLVCSPPEIGSTAICVPAPEVADILRRETARYVELTHYQGLGSLEFKRDGRSARFLIIEPTVGRTDWQEEIATLCGVNLPLIAYHLALGEPVSAPRHPPGPVSIWRDSWEFQVPRAMAPAGAPVIDAYFRWHDPLPGVYHYAYERGVRRVARRAVRVLRATTSLTRRRIEMELETVIIGAGPYGLSLAAHLGAMKLPYHVFGRPLESWRRFMPAGMVLKSEPFASNLWDPARRYTLEQYCRHQKIPYEPVARPVSLELFLRYADWFRHNAVAGPEEVRVRRIHRANGGFALRLEDDRVVTSRRVVLAAGHMAFHVMPPELSGLPAPQVVHSAHMGPLNRYAGREVTVIGAGQSALESAALLHEAGARVRVIARSQRLLWNEPSQRRSLLQRIRAPDAGIASGWGSVAISELPRTFRWMFAPAKRHRFVATSYGPSGAWWLRDRFVERIEVRLSSRIESASMMGDRVRLQVARAGGAEEYVTDYVIAGTGFRVDINRLDYLDPGLTADLRTEAEGIPALSPRFETSLPGLYMAGIASAPVFGPIMRFMYGAKHAAPIIARALR